MGRSPWLMFWQNLAKLLSSKYKQLKYVDDGGKGKKGGGKALSVRAAYMYL
jgi:hypothetical protein